MRTLSVRWRSGESAGTTDVFLADQFSRVGRWRHRAHEVTEPGRVSGFAVYDLAVRGDTAELDYSAYPRENRRADMLPGRMRIIFTDQTRSTVDRIEWAAGRGRRFHRADVEWRWRERHERPYQPKRRMAKKRRIAKDRPGQAKFKAGLMAAYDGRCCISDCAVGAVLEGAHIDPYENPSHDHLANGLLLRADIHRLFDERLLAIDPKTLKVVLAPSVRGEPLYRQFRTKKVRLPRHGPRPDRRALGRRLRTLQTDSAHE